MILSVWFDYGLRTRALVVFGHTELRAYTDLGRARCYSWEIAHEDNIPIISLTMNSLDSRKITKLLYAMFLTFALYLVFPKCELWGSHVWLPGGIKQE